MSREEYSPAYDLSMFETAQTEQTEEAHDSNNIIRLPAKGKQEPKRRRHNPFMMFGVIVLVLISTAVLATIVQSNVRLNELNESLVATEEEITKLQNQAEQYQVAIDSKLSLETIQQYAEEELGMTKAQSNQKIFISLTDGDVGEVVTEDESDNILDMMSQAFRGLWS